MLEFKDYYKVLGVARDATADQIKKAYRKLARQYHPDVSSQPDAADRMSQINEAYAALSDAERRAAYDALGTGPESPAPRPISSATSSRSSSVARPVAPADPRCAAVATAPDLRCAARITTPASCSTCRTP